LNEELKNKLEQAHKILFMEGLAEDATRGHLTVKSDNNRIYIKPWGMKVIARSPILAGQRSNLTMTIQGEE